MSLYDGKPFAVERGMITRKAVPQLPFPDRRQGRRYLTKKTVLATIGILAVLFLVITIRSEMRGDNGEDYGRLYEKQAQKLQPVEPQAVPVVTEAEAVSEATSADPFSLDAAKREQYLGDTRLTPPPATASTIGFGGQQPASSLRVEGGPDGVTVTNTEPRPQPVLGGGFGRP